MSETDPRAAALSQTREHGLWGRADSPPDWQAALDGATAGDPVLVKSPDDRRDDFFLVPMHPRHPAARTAWVILDRETLKLREASLLDHWPVPAFPDEKDRARVSQTPLTLPDGTRARFRADDLRPNLKNFVWKPSEAAILPYWPVKEFIAPHPLTREPVSIYLTQDGNILTDFDEERPQNPPASPAFRKKSMVAAGIILVLSAVLSIAALQFLPSKAPTAPTPAEGPTPRLQTPEVKQIEKAVKLSPHLAEPTRKTETPNVRHTEKPVEVYPAPDTPSPEMEPARKNETPEVKPTEKPKDASPPQAEPAPPKPSR